MDKIENEYASSERGDPVVANDEVFDRGGLVVSPPLNKSRLLRFGDWCRSSDCRISWDTRSETKKNSSTMGYA